MSASSRPDRDPDAIGIAADQIEIDRESARLQLEPHASLRPSAEIFWLDDLDRAWPARHRRGRRRPGGGFGGRRPHRARHPTQQIQIASAIEARATSLQPAELCGRAGRFSVRDAGRDYSGNSFVDR